MRDIPNTARAWAIELGASLAAGALLGVFGPFGSFLNDVVLIRVAYWSLVLLAIGVAFGLAVRILTPRMRRAGVPIVVWMPVMILAISLPLTPLTRAIATVFWPAIGQRVGLVDWYGQTVLVGLVYACLHVLLPRGGARSDARPAPDKPEPPRILRHLPPRLSGDLLCLSMEDHYVRLHTAGGSVLVLMSLNQAMEELGSLDGLRVHRSWWVARNAVEGVVEEGRNMRLVLKGGLQAPVSRASVARLRLAGWLAA